MNNYYYDSSNYFLPYYILNPIKNYHSSRQIQYNNNKNYLSRNLSQLGYQIINPQIINYQLEPIYSTMSINHLSKSTSHINSIRTEIGEPVENDSVVNKGYNLDINYDKINLISNNNSRNRTIPENNYYHKSETQLILDTINKLQKTNSNNINNTTPTKELIRYKNENIVDKNRPIIKKEFISPFLRYSKDYSIKGKEIGKRFGKMDLNLKANCSTERKIILKRRTKREWLNLFKHFINIYTFFSSAKKYSYKTSQIRNNEIYVRTRHIIKDIAILKDWIISIEESFFNEFKNYENFNSRLNEKQSKKSILKVIKIFVNNLKNGINEIPEKVQAVLFQYIKKVCYFPKKYLSKFQIIRMDFNFYGGTKNLTINHKAMILSYLIINGVCVQQILLHINEVFTEFSECSDIDGAVRNIGSILHYLVRDIFKKKQKKTNDILALFNYYRNYHLYNEKLEKLKDNINKKINIEEKDNDDEYIELLLSYSDVKEFFDENEQFMNEIKNDIYNCFIELAKIIKNNFKDESFISYKEKRRKK